MGMGVGSVSKQAGGSLQRGEGAGGGGEVGSCPCVWGVYVVSTYTCM